MIDTDKYDNEGIELSDGGTICFPESDGRMERIDEDGNTMEVRYLTNNEGQEWYDLFDTHKDLIAEVKRLRKDIADLVICWDNSQDPSWFMLKYYEMAQTMWKEGKTWFGKKVIE
jgi:hypothetical protein